MHAVSSAERCRSLGEAIIDTGARRTIIGEERVQSLIDALGDVQVPTGPMPTNRRSIRESRRTIFLPFPPLTHVSLAW